MASDTVTSRSVPAAQGDIPERFVPDEMRGQLVEAEHVARYSWAATFCAGRRVFDAGCGVGYGADLLSSAGASEVVALDNSATALELARSHGSQGVTYELGDVRSLTYDDATFDVVVCFEVIEHVDEQEQVLDELARVLRPDGLLLISSPNRDRYVPGNPHHRHEFTRGELQSALDARFQAARIISQHAMLASVISWSAAPTFEPVQTSRAIEAEPEDELYLLAMAGGDLPPDPGSVAVLTRFAEPRRWLEHMDAQKRWIDQQQRRLEDLESREADRRDALTRLAEAEAELAVVRARRWEFEEAQRELQAAKEREEDHLRELAQLRVIAGSRSWRMTAPLRRAAAEIRAHRP